jgi:hypothetical protein
MIQAVRIALLAALGLLPLSGTAAEVTRTTLREVSQQVLAAFNAGDGAALHGMLAADLQAALTASSLGGRLEACRARLGTMERLSLPVMSTWTYGMYAAYFGDGARDLFLELDRDGRILHLTIAGTGDSCSLAGS